MQPLQTKSYFFTLLLLLHESLRIIYRMLRIGWTGYTILDSMDDFEQNITNKFFSDLDFLGR